RYADEQKNSVRPAKKCQVHISPWGRIGANQCDRCGKLKAKIAILMPVSRLTTNAIAVVQWRTIVPISLRGGLLPRSLRSTSMVRGLAAVGDRAPELAGSPSRAAISAITSIPPSGSEAPENGLPPR